MKTTTTPTTTTRIALALGLLAGLSSLLGAATGQAQAQSPGSSAPPLASDGAGDGASRAGGFAWSRVGLELGGGFTRAIDDGYTRRLRDFGFDDQIFMDPRWSVAVTYALRTNIDLVLDFGELDAAHWRRDNDPPHDFSWSTYSAALSLRYTYIAPGGWLRPFAQAGAGVARAHSVYDMTGMPGTDEDDFWGYRLSAAAGVQLVPWRRLGVFWRLGYDYAPVLENLIGDVHDSGGLNCMMGLLTRF